MATNEEMKLEYSILSDVWKFYKENYKVETTQEYWNEVLKQSKELLNKYENNELCKDLLVALICDLERKFTIIN